MKTALSIALLVVSVAGIGRELHWQAACRELLAQYEDVEKDRNVIRHFYNKRLAEDNAPLANFLEREADRYDRLRSNTIR